MSLIIKLIYLNTPNALDAISITKIRLTCWEFYKDAVLEKLWYYSMQWEDVSIFGDLSAEFMAKYSDELYWGDLSKYQSLSQLMKPVCSKYVDIWQISKRDDLTVNFIDKHPDVIEWWVLSSNRFLKPAIVRKFADMIDWDRYSNYIDEGLIEEFESYINWYELSNRPIYNKEIIRKYVDKLDWVRFSQVIPDGLRPYFSNYIVPICADNMPYFGLRCHFDPVWYSPYSSVIINFEPIKAIRVTVDANLAITKITHTNLPATKPVVKSVTKPIKFPKKIKQPIISKISAKRLKQRNNRFTKPFR